MSSLATILSNLKSQIIAGEAGVVQTVKRSIENPPEIYKYSSSQLPIVFIIEPEHEEYLYRPSQRTYTEVLLSLYLYFLSGNPESDAESLASNNYIDPVLIAVNSDPTLNGACVDLRVRDKVLFERDFPLYGWKVTLSIKYEQSDLIR